MPVSDVPKTVLALLVAVAIAVVPGITAAHLFGASIEEGLGVSIRYALASALVVGFFYAMRVRRGPGGAAGVVALNLRLLPLLALPLLPLLADPKVASGRGGLALAAILVPAALMAVSRLHGAEPQPRRRPRLELPGIILAAAVVGGWLAWLAWVRHASMQTNTYDFGLFTNAIWNTSQGRWFACTLVPTGSILDEHVSLALVGFAALLKLGLPPVGLLALQALCICAGAVPAYMLGRRHLGSAGGRVFAFAYLVHPSVHANALWDFHPLSFAAPLVMVLVLLGERRRLHPLFGLSVVGLLLLREEMAFVVIAYAAVLALRGRPQRAAGLVALAVAFLLALNVAMGQTSSHLSRYAELAEHGGGGLTGMVIAAVFDPVFLLGHALTYAKVVYVGMQAAGVLGLAALARRAWPVLALAVAFSMLATSRHVFNPYFHYTTMLYPLVLAWAPEGLSRLACVRWSRAPLALRRRALLVAVAVASTLVSFGYGGLSDNGVFRAGFTAPRREISEASVQRLAWLEAQLAQLPEGVPMAVTGRIGPHVATRPHVYAYPAETSVDVLVLFSGDLRKEQRAQLAEEQRAGRWQKVAFTGSIWVLRRGRP